MIGFDRTPEGKILDTPEFPSWRSRHPVDARRAAERLIEDQGDEAPISVIDELQRRRTERGRELAEEPEAKRPVDPHGTSPQTDPLEI
jgi:hypothetical protein